MPAVIIADASCLILLAKIDKIWVLQRMYGEIAVTPTVYEEVGLDLPLWVKVVQPASVRNSERLHYLLDGGEASSISLALDFRGSLVVLDDLKARKVAQKLKLTVTGTLGVLMEAKRRGHISSVKSVVDAIRKTNFRISVWLEHEVLRQAGEET